MKLWAIFASTKERYLGLCGTENHCMILSSVFHGCGEMHGCVRNGDVREHPETNLGHIDL